MNNPEGCQFPRCMCRSTCTLRTGGTPEDGNPFKVVRHLAAQHPMIKPNPIQINDLVRRYYRTHPAGGPLHIMLDDGNVEQGHIDFCRERAKEASDEPGQHLCDVMEMFTLAEREALFASNFESLDPNYVP